MSEREREGGRERERERERVRERVREREREREGRERKSMRKFKIQNMIHCTFSQSPHAMTYQWLHQQIKQHGWQTPSL